MKTIILDDQSKITIEDLHLLSQRKAELYISSDDRFKDHIKRGAKFLHNKLDLEGCIYGVTTGYGDDCTQGIPLDLVDELPTYLARFHGCGLGEFLTVEQTRLVMVIRLTSICRGFSGVSYALLKRLEMLIKEDILPVIPSEGSVGASGDLTPLSYIAAVLMGEREVWYKKEKRETGDILRELGIEPYKLRPKEALAIMNGTAVMTGLATEVFRRAEYLVVLASRLTAMTSLALLGNPNHYDEYLFAAKPHPGQMLVASYIRADLCSAPNSFIQNRLQDRYSTRCAPHVIGVLADMLPTFRILVETEINSANDNPLIDFNKDPRGRVLHGGHFYGGHIAFVMDGLKILIANIADLLDRQMATLVDTKFNNGLPANLSGATGRRKSINHGLKAVHIGASAWAAEALKGTMPASVFSRSTESHNQDKVSMGTIAARDALRLMQLTEQVAAAQLLATVQSLRLRERKGMLTQNNYSSNMIHFLNEVHKTIPFIEEDQRLDGLLRNIVDNLQKQNWSIYRD